MRDCVGRGVLLTVLRVDRRQGVIVVVSVDL